MIKVLSFLTIVFLLCAFPNYANVQNLDLVIWLLTLRAVQKAGLDGLCIMIFELGCGFDLGKYDETVIDVGTTVNF